jgi:histone H3/H4
MSDSVIVRTKIKEIVKEINVGGDFADALNEKVIEMIKKAIQRAEANGRKTIMAKDL